MIPYGFLAVLKKLPELKNFLSYLLNMRTVQSCNMNSGGIYG